MVPKRRRNNTNSKVAVIHVLESVSTAASLLAWASTTSATWAPQTIFALLPPIVMLLPAPVSLEKMINCPASLRELQPPCYRYPHPFAPIHRFRRPDQLLSVKPNGNLFIVDTNRQIRIIRIPCRSLRIRHQKVTRLASYCGQILQNRWATKQSTTIPILSTAEFTPLRLNDKRTAHTHRRPSKPSYPSRPVPWLMTRTHAANACLHLIRCDLDGLSTPPCQHRLATSYPQPLQISHFGHPWTMAASPVSVVVRPSFVLIMSVFCT